MNRATRKNLRAFIFVAALGGIVIATSAYGQATATRPVVRYAEVNANDVYVRSGDSTNHYTVCKLDAGARVAVVSERGDWVEILPPAGTFSLISGDYVDTADDKTGVVGGENVRVRAGSSLNDNKYTVQMMLSRGAKVTILGRNPDGFLRINPPAGATLWIHSDYLSDAPGSAAPATTLGAGTSPDELDSTDPGGVERPPAAAASPVGPTGSPSVSGAAILTWRNELETLDATAKAELQKQPRDRDFAPLLARYQVVVEQGDDEYASRYAGIRVAQLENIQSIAAAVERVRSLGGRADVQRQKFMEERASLPRPLPDVPSGVTAQGELRVSALYPPGSTVRRYRLIDPSASFERTIGYVEIPKDATIDVKSFIGRYVGVRASQTRLQKGGVDPIPIFIAEELVLLDSPPPVVQEQR